MVNGLMVDLHGTLLRSNEAWIDALSEFDPSRREFYTNQVNSKRSRHELAAIAGTDFETVDNCYYEKLRPREDILELVKLLNSKYPSVLVSNAQEYRVLRDLKRLPDLSFLRIFTAKNGSKLNKDYLETILTEMNWDKAFLIGNDLEEDFVESPLIIPLLVPDKRKCYYFKTRQGEQT